MADNVSVTAGAGTTISTDDVSGVHYQRVKLVNGTLDATDAIPGEATNGLDVDVTRVQGTVTVSQSGAGTATLTNVTASASSVSVLASNAARRGVLLHNDSTATLYLKFGATASTTSYSVKLYPDDQWVMDPPAFTGAIDGIWSAANGAARVTELT